MSSKKESQESETNITFNGNITGIGVVTGGEVHQTIIQEKKKKVLKQLSSSLGKSSNFIGREEELKEINQKLNHSNTLLINGFGGVGKSTIASRYLQTQKEQFDYYGFFEGINGFIRELERAFGLKKELSKDSLLDVIYELRGLKNSKKLLVIDDVKEIEKNKKQIEKILALKENGCTILLTSREQIEDIEIYSLNVLSLDDAKVLFNSIFKMEDESLLEEIVTYLDCHAFFVEMTAKSLSVNTQRTPEKMIKMFRDGKLSKIKANKNESFNDFLNQQFSLDSLDDEDSLLLKQLSLLPSVEINFKFLTKVFGLTDEEEVEDFQDLLNTLVKKGWLSSDGRSYKLHQIIKEFIWANHQPTLEEIDKVVLFFAKLIEIDDDIQSAVLLKGYFVYFEAIDNVLNRVGVFNEKITNFWENLGAIYEYNGLYNEALPFYIKVVEVKENVYGKNHLSTALSYHNLAVNYRKRGIYIKAKIFFLKAIKIKEKEFGKKHLNTINSYNSLAVVYKLMEDYEKAEHLYFKAIKIREKLLGNEHPDTASSYTNLAVLYDTKGLYEKAEHLYLNALQIREKVLGEEHSDTASSYHNLAVLYKSKGLYEKAEHFYLKALQISEKMLGSKHPYTAISYGGLGILYYEQEDFEKAYIYVKKSVDIYSKVLIETHPKLIKSKEWLVKIEKKLPLTKT